MVKDRGDILYLGAGPAALPTDVLEDASKALLNYEGTGLGIGEHSHRSAHAAKIIEEAKNDLAKYLDIPDDYDILFMQAGGTGEFSATVYNLVGAWVAKKNDQAMLQTGGDKEEALELLKKWVSEELKLDYLVTGGWSLKAYQEACRLLGKNYVNLAVDGRPSNNDVFGRIPPEGEWKLSEDPAMVYYCDNETVDGVEFPQFPDILKPKEDGTGPNVVADMSSNILSRRVPVKNYSVIFFGAQKNLGLAGVTVTIIKKTLLPPACTQPSADLMRQLGLPIGPIILSYEMIAKNNSLYNTLSIFDVYVAGRVLKKLLATYPDKVDGQEAVSNQKSKMIYDALDKRPDIYRILPDRLVRSRMNICFRVILDQSMEMGETLFMEKAKQQGLDGIKGHRSVGGIRISNYNSISLNDAKKIANFIDKFCEQ